MRPSKGLVIFCLFLIEVLSLVTIWSTVPELFLTQLSFALVGAIIIYILNKSDINLFFSFSWFLYFLSIFLLVVTMFVGKNIRGSVRWIDFGFFNLQTSELIKPILALFYAQYLANNDLKKMKDFLFFLVVAFIPILMVAKQPDLGSALTISVIPLALLLFSGHGKRLFIVGAVFLLVAVPIESKLLKPYQRERIESFINPYKDPKGSGYNVIQATIAIGSGGVFGKGVKLGTQSHLNFLPERHTDFIFASYAEEFGLVGIGVLVSAYFFLLNYFLKVTSYFKRKQQYLFSLSVFSVFLFQITVNMGMNLGIMPVTGITLPIFSYGGSSLLSFAIFIGLELCLLDLITPFEL